MEKIINWIIQHKKISIAFIFVCIFLPILVTHILFKIHSNCYWIEAEWKAGELLGYFGDVLSFVGTIVLGIVAVSQTQKANNMNKELLMIEKNRIKPCMDISSQIYKIYLAENINEKISKIDRNNVMIMDLMYTKNPQTGITVESVLIELNVFNSGGSDIRRIFVKNPYFYLSVIDPFNCESEKLVLMSGNTGLKVGENRKLYIHVTREVDSDKEIFNRWYEEHSKKLMPHMEFEFTLETIEGNSYAEKITCGSSWDSSMKSTKTLAVRSAAITDISVNEIYRNEE